jgi:hypothetical protein
MSGVEVVAIVVILCLHHGGCIAPREFQLASLWLIHRSASNKHIDAAVRHCKFFLQRSITQKFRRIGI